MKYKVGDKVLYTCEDGLSEPIEAVIYEVSSRKSSVYPYIVRYLRSDGTTGDLACDEELSPLEPEQLRQREQFFTDGEPDMVNHPPHYANKDPETINMIRAVLTEEEFIGGLKWQILKYRDRAHDKGNYEQDMAKAKFYYDLLQEVTERRLSK